MFCFLRNFEITVYYTVSVEILFVVAVDSYSASSWMAGATPPLLTCSWFSINKAPMSINTWEIIIPHWNILWVHFLNYLLVTYLSLIQDLHVINQFGTLTSTTSSSLLTGSSAPSCYSSPWHNINNLPPGNLYSSIQASLLSDSCKTKKTILLRF